MAGATRCRICHRGPRRAARSTCSRCREPRLRQPGVAAMAEVVGGRGGEDAEAEVLRERLEVPGARIGGRLVAQAEERDGELVAEEPEPGAVQRAFADRGEGG